MNSSRNCGKLYENGLFSLHFASLRRNVLPNLHRQKTKNVTRKMSFLLLTWDLTLIITGLVGMILIRMKVVVVSVINFAMHSNHNSGTVPRDLHMILRKV